ncbi:uncharacterized protein HMPREF1541_02866 [Cyphellophora europaea CBS 101466]|uniref:Cell wall proline rich protein n=1 Tax=Cyphellophora europaea (strain CBS 101466) TaxID=1220924 RepID=W2S4T9_CYPE1|nr:uncharacterized protein HMPREF1541_02866 [Cyphellophora europaea CBS 101466]ETN43707.1 hypothetical protein HMPREF1541_02866 [Cyphellophora europaea CBS 101466]
MASVSLPPPSMGASPFDGPNAPSSPSRHRRAPSRTPKPERLPAFSFNPGADTTQESVESDENLSVEDDSRDCPKRGLPPPLPDFSFNPAANLPSAEREVSPTHPVLQEMALNQQRVSRSARPAPLPAFTFGSTTSSGTPSPTRSTFPELPGSSGMGHRRRGSEFVGGGKEGSQLVGTSPGKSDYRPPPVSGPPRGHMHRRSQAISVSDIDTSDLIKTAALSKARVGSQPTTPSEPGFTVPKYSPPRQSFSQSQSTPSSPQRRESMSGIRPRVGFADRVDVIPQPRPLSLISSETEGSCSTVRGHSLSGSINSIYPTSAVSSPTNSRVMDDSPPKQRPHTADPATLLSPVLSREEREESMSMPKRPLSASGSPAVTLSGSPPNKKKHFWFSPSAHSSPSPTPKSEKEDPLADIQALPNLDPIDPPRPRTSPERCSSIKKKKKYHTWTSGIFSRKSAKRHAKNSKRVATPPTLVRRPSDRINEIFDADDTVVLREPSPVVQRARPKSNPLMGTAPSFSAHVPTSPVEASGPVLDLDAAMTDGASPDTPTRGAASRIAKLHSSERRGQMDPFGAFHKRSESAPAMQPVNRASFGMQRMGSNQSLSEEVFDEEEEDNFLAGKTGDNSKNENVRSSNPTRPAEQATALDGLGLAVTTDDVVIVDPEDDVPVDPQRSSTATIEAPVISVETKRPVSSPMFFAYSAPHSHYASSTEGRTTSASMISSPDAEHVSFESFPRNARNFGETSSEFVLRGSNEDLPSLSDSISSSALPRMSSSANTRSSIEQRAHSVCVPVTSRSNQPAWKRASLASLNRLMPGSANGSNLKFETVAPETTPADEKEKRKSNRLSKLMKFWRMKEKGTAGE